MVAGVLLVIGLAVGAFIFKDQIAAAFASASLNLAVNPLKEAGAGLKQAGVDARKNIDLQILQTNRESKVKEIEKAAINQGFSSIEEFERATDSCSLVVGSSRTMCDVGLIGSKESITPKGGQSFVGTGASKVGGKTGGLIISPKIIETRQRRARAGR